MRTPVPPLSRSGDPTGGLRRRGSGPAHARCGPSRRLGTTPSAIDATASKHRLAYATLDSSAAILDGLAAHNGADFTDSHEAVRRLRDHLAAAPTTADVVGPALYEWYFRALRMIRRDEFATLLPHARKLPLVWDCCRVRSPAGHRRYAGRDIARLYRQRRQVLQHLKLAREHSPVARQVGKIHLGASCTIGSERPAGRPLYQYRHPAEIDLEVSLPAPLGRGGNYDPSSGTTRVGGAAVRSGHRRTRFVPASGRSRCAPLDPLLTHRRSTSVRRRWDGAFRSAGPS